MERAIVLRLRRPAPQGWKDAKCIGIAKRIDDEDIYDPFFDEEDTSPATEFCNGDADGVVCPIRNECLLFALTNNERFGVWGGMNEEDRRIVRKRWPWRSGREPRPEWRWLPHDEIQNLLTPDERDAVDDGEEGT